MAILATMIALVVPSPEISTVERGATAKATTGCRTHWCHKRWHVVAPYNRKLERIADCESSRRWHLATGNGFYGGLQFTLGTWRAIGGRSYPHMNSRLEQKYRAVLWHNRIGTWVTAAGWPVCGYR